jgi:hypothetical protein
MALTGYGLRHGMDAADVYVFHLWGEFFGRIGGWATGTHSNYLAGYLWRYFGDGAGIGVVVFIHAAVIGVASWPRRRVIGFTVAFAVFPVWTGLVLTDALAPTGRALFPLTTTTLILSLVGHLIFGAMLGYGLSVSLPRAPHCAPAPRMAAPRARVAEPVQAACGPPATRHDLPRAGHRALTAHSGVLLPRRTGFPVSSSGSTPCSGRYNASSMSRSAAIFWRVGGQPLRYERVDGCAARAVTGDGGQELFPAQGERAQGLLRYDSGRSRDIA